MQTGDKHWICDSQVIDCEVKLAPSILSKDSWLRRIGKALGFKDKDGSRVILADAGVKK